MPLIKGNLFYTSTIVLYGIFEIMLYSVCVLFFSWLICNPAKEGKAVCVCECVKDG